MPRFGDYAELTELSDDDLVVVKDESGTRSVALSSLREYVGVPAAAEETLAVSLPNLVSVTTSETDADADLSGDFEDFFVLVPGFASLTSGSDNADSTTYTSASISPSANSLIIVGVTSSHDTVLPTISVSGLSGITWAEQVVEAGSTLRLSVWSGYCGATPGSGTLTFTMSSTSTACKWSVIEVMPGSFNPTGTFVQNAKSTATSTSVGGSSYLAAGGSSNNGQLFFVTHAANEVTTPRAGWVEMHDVAHASPVGALESQYRSGSFTRDASASWSTSSLYVAIAVEIKAPAAV